MTVQERLARLEGQVADIKEDLREIKIGINGPLDGRSVRDRLHKLETSDSAAIAAAAAVDAAKRIRQDTWSIWTKNIVLACSIVSTVISVSVALSHT